jgi:hypothetical protein
VFVPKPDLYTIGRGSLHSHQARRKRSSCRATDYTAFLASYFSHSRSPAHLRFKQPLFELKGSAAYKLTVDVDVHAIGANSERSRVQVVYVLAIADPEVRAGVGRNSVNEVVDLFVTCCARSIHSDCGRRQVATRVAIAGEPKLYRNHSAPDVKDARPVSIDRLLHLRSSGWRRGWSWFALARTARVHDGSDF